MYITPRDAQSIVDEMKACIHRDINIIDENGVIEWAKEKVKPDTNAAEILEYLG